LVLLLLVTRGQLRIEWRDLPLLALLGAILFTVFPVTFNGSLRLIEASRGALILATIPLWSALLSRATRSERLVFRQVVGVLLSLAGVGLVRAEDGLDWDGGLEGLLGDALSVITFAMVLGTLLLLPAALVEDPVGVIQRLDGRTVALLVFLGVFGGALAFFLWTFALTRLTPTQVAVYINLNPLVAAVLGAALLAERLTIIFTVGFGAVLLGVLLVNWPGRTATAPTFQSR
jgi:drug/metabolite transporter (DMT)-like permease